MLNRYESLLPNEYLKDKIEGKKILVMGSGPSVDLRNWANLDFDYIATVSFWYNRQDLLERSDILFTAYSNLVDLSNSKLQTYLDTHDTIVGLEENSHGFYNTSGFKNFKTKYDRKYVNFWTKHHSDAPYIGLAGRLIFFMLNFNPSTLYYIGVDGVSNNPEQDPSNSFRMGLRSNTAKGVVGIDDVAEIRKSHLNMAKIIDLESKSRGISLYNLGEGLPFNMSGEYSKIHYPLNEEIIKLIEK
jgi:hypothetical protein